jgi:hypothetical protein
VIPAIHEAADIFETDIALFQFFMGQYPDAPRSRIVVFREGKIHFIDAMAFCRRSECGLGSLRRSAEQNAIFRLHD